MENLPEEIQEKLKEFADKRANEVEDVDIREFIDCVVDGAIWMYKKINNDNT